MSKSRFSTKQLATAGIIAALYAVLSYFSSIFGIAIIALPSGVITAGYLEEVNKD